MTDFIHFGTQRDWGAVKELIKRSDLGLKEPGVVRVEPVANEHDVIACDHRWQDDDWDYHSCDRPAAVRVVRNRSVKYDGMEPADTPADVYSDTFCVSCIDRALTDYLETVVENVRRQVDDADARPVRADGSGQLPEDGARVADGRRSRVHCQNCDPGHDLAVDVDPVDDVLYVYCEECGDGLAHAQPLWAGFEATFVAQDVEGVDPRLIDSADNVADRADLRSLGGEDGGE